MNQVQKDIKSLIYRRTISIPAEVNDWLEQRAAIESRSVSSYLTALLVRERNGN